MRTATVGWAVAAAGVLTSCTSTAQGTASPGGPPDLAAALSVPLPGFRSADPPRPPEQLCTTAVGTRAPRLDPALGEPVAVGHTSADTASEDTTLHAYAWATSAPMVAEAILRQAEAEAPDCVSAPPPADAGPGARIARSVDDWTGSGWTGVRIRTEVSGPDPAVGETRLVRADEVVMLVVLTAEGSAPDLRPVDEHLAAVADRLG